MTKFKNKPLIEGSSGFLLAGSLICFFIAASPYLFYLYEIFPDGPVWENSFFTYHSNYYRSVNVAMWTYLGKLVPLLLLLIWFFTCKHWWYHALLIPIGMYVYQLIIASYQDIYLHIIPMDVNGLVYLAPFFLVILVILYFIRIQIFDRIYGIDLSELEETNTSVFNKKKITTKEEKEEIDHFRKDGISYRSEPTEEYYTKL